MAFKFSSDPQAFYTAYRNGVNFDQNLTEYSERLRGNAGDLVQMTETITVECSVNETLSIPMEYDATTGTITAPIDFRSEGLSIGATIQVFQGRSQGESTVGNITGRGFNTIVVDTTNLTFLTSGLKTDIYIRCKDAPTYMRYQYGLIPDKVRTETEDLWNSPIDGNPQAYYAYDLVGPSIEYFTMKRFGPFKSWDLSTGVVVAYLGTTGDFYHEYTIQHTFKICPYVDTERDNIINSVPPPQFAGVNTLKYANKIFLGYTADIIGSVTNLGVTGDVGYYGENYNGKENIYAVDEVLVNGVEDDKLSTPVNVNSIDVKLTNTGNAFTADQKVIVTVLRLSGDTDYTNKKLLTYDEAFVSEQVVQEAGAASVDGSIVKNLLVTFNTDEDIDTELDLDFSTDQIEKIKTGDIYVLIFATGDNTKDPDAEDNVSLAVPLQFSFKDDELGLIDNVEFNYYDSYSAFSGTRVYTNRSLWNGDFVVFNIPFTMLQYNDATNLYNRIIKIESRLVLVSDTDPLDYKVLFTKDMPIDPVAPFNAFDSGTYIYQLCNGSSNDTDKLPTDEPVNLNEVTSLPPFAGSTQAFEVNGSVPRIPWREWIANNDLPIVFYDPAETNNNLNQRTSNYSGLEGYSVCHELYMLVEKTRLLPETKPGSIPELKPVSIVTTYQLRSDAFDVIDFDVDGNPSVVISGEVFIYEPDGDLTDVISDTTPRLIEVDIDHDLGTLVLGDLWAEIWIERTNGTGEVSGQLHSVRNWNNSTNALTGSQEVSPTNLNYVEIVSELNKVYLYCLTNPNNITEGSYNVYWRLGKRTV